MFIKLLKFEHLTCHLTFGKTLFCFVIVSLNFAHIYQQLFKVSLHFAHICQQLFEVRFQAIFQSWPMLAIIVKNEK